MCDPWSFFQACIVGVGGAGVRAGECGYVMNRKSLGSSSHGSARPLNGGLCLSERNFGALLESSRDKAGSCLRPKMGDREMEVLPRIGQEEHPRTRRALQHQR